MARRGGDARLALVETAERLFAERGIEAVSLRDVSAAAGQRNHSAAQYHFGDRRGLVAAVYEARMTVVHERRGAYLVDIERNGRGHDLEALVEAAVVPLIDVVAETDGSYARFLARSRWDTFAWSVLAHIPAATSYRTVIQRIKDGLGELPRPIRVSRIEQLVTLGIGTIAGWEGAPERGLPRLPPDVLAADLVATSVAVLRVPHLPVAADRFTDLLARPADPIGARP